MIFRPGRDRWYTKDDKLVISTATGAFVLSAWPDCRAWRTDRGSPWTQFRPRDPVLRKVRQVARPGYVQRAMAELVRRRDGDTAPPRLEAHRAGLTRRHQAAVQFLGAFPRAVRGRVAPLPERHWHVLSLLARCPGAAELFESNPALAFALASSWAFRPRAVARPLRSARSLLSKPRTAIAEWLAFPATPADVRVLSKLLPRALSINTLLFLRQALRSGTGKKALWHLPELALGVLRIVTDPELERFASYSLLREVAEASPHVCSAAYLLRDTARMHADLRGGRPLPVQRSLAGLTLLHDELTHQLNAASLERICLRLPAAPLAGTDAIVPLTTPRALLEEGREMRHCVFSYLPYVRAGVMYIYRVLEPERATLGIARSGGAEWRLAQLLGPSNAKVAPQTWAAVSEWLEAQCSGT